MDLTWTDEERAFQLQVRRFIEASFPAAIRETVEQCRRQAREDYVRWQKILNDKVCMFPSWPV